MHSPKHPSETPAPLSEQEKYVRYSRYARMEESAPNKSRKPLIITLTVILIAALLAGAACLYCFVIHPGTLRSSVPQTECLSEVITECPEPVTETPETEMSFSPHCTASTDPDRMIEYTEIEYNGEVFSDASSITPWYNMDFGTGDTYTQAEGVITFRGNNFRNAPAWGTADMKDFTITDKWYKTTGGLTYNGTSWSGSGWTGQPLLMKWPASAKAHMNMTEEAKADDSLVEVIYACMDGYIYFLDLKTGTPTRDPLYLGFTFKGAGALDPRGYPILYLGAGYDSSNGRARVFVINLLDCSVMYTFGDSDSFSLRGNLSYFDSSALVDAASDTLIYPGENGLIYLIRLNTAYDEEAGTLSIAPSDTIKWRYNGLRTSTASYWLGMEDSAAIYKGYLYIADNGGHLMCLNLNTLQLVWVQDILDDSNSTPVLSVENGHLYLYVSTSFRLGWRSSSTAVVPIWKIDAETGEIIWQTDYECYSQDGVSGGVQSTIALGEQSLSNYLYVTVARTPDYASGVLSCLDKETGRILWEDQQVYTWSSPVCVYTDDGIGKVLYCSCNGNMYLLDGETGEVRSSIALSEGAIEASPAVFDNYVVIGTRACRIWGLELS